MVGMKLWSGDMLLLWQKSQEQRGVRRHILGVELWVGVAWKGAVLPCLCVTHGQSRPRGL